MLELNIVDLIDPVSSRRLLDVFELDLVDTEVAGVASVSKPQIVEACVVEKASGVNIQMAGRLKQIPASQFCANPRAKDLPHGSDSKVSEVCHY